MGMPCVNKSYICSNSTIDYSDMGICISSTVDKKSEQIVTENTEDIIECDRKSRVHTEPYNKLELTYPCQIDQFLSYHEDEYKEDNEQSIGRDDQEMSEDTIKPYHKMTYNSPKTELVNDARLNTDTN
eukprot:TRINITY_DN1651_c0_g2_i12.p1 TRINITY_DN1651_c0_g2~~TRINITY_DN1651_c0_g2_i12.p1  ORF type:complete len:128 (-),score=2.75 TRINITY_DN1651_c0_g2_i12:96-479(-)